MLAETDPLLEASAVEDPLLDGDDDEVALLDRATETELVADADALAFRVGAAETDALGDAS